MKYGLLSVDNELLGRPFILKLWRKSYFMKEIIPPYSMQRKPIIIWFIFIFLGMLLIMASTMLWDYYALWSYASIPVSTLQIQDTSISNQISTLKSAKALTPAPAGSTDATSTIKPTAAPIPHPGDRDGKFTQGEIIIDEMSYKSHDLSIEINKYSKNDIVYFVSEVYVRDMNNFISAFAEDKFGSATDITSNISKDNDAVFAVSGDYYNARDTGIVIRNSILYRTQKDLERDLLAVYGDGSLKGYDINEIEVEALVDENVVHTFVFGPLLISNYEEVIDYDDTDMTRRHPRCAIGIVEPYHYYFIVADGRSQGYSIGMTIFELSQKFKELNCETAYILDGGRSATMVFMGNLINLPIGIPRQREIGDIICFIEDNN